MRGPDQEPWADVRSASTTSAPKDGKIRRPRRAKDASRRQATPHPLASSYGVHTPVTLQFVIRTGADIWAEVRTHEGRFFVPFDASVFDLVKLVIEGGYWIQPHTTVTKSEHARGVGKLGRRSD